MKERLLQSFESVFGNQEQAKVFYAPGRVNLIGEHIDYNGGFVFPAAISLGTYGVARLRSDETIRLYSENYPDNGIIEVNLRDMEYQYNHGWANYAKGIITFLLSEGRKLPVGFDLYVSGNLPTASGLSSSASLEVLVAYIANDLYQLNISRVDIALMAQRVENEYMGMHCGIMDQLIIACGIKNKALLMNTATLHMEPYDATFDGYQFIIMNTNYARKTTDSKYNERVAECAEAKNVLKKSLNFNHLCELKPDLLPTIQSLISSDVIYRRVKHVITEQARTIDSVKAMTQNDAKWFGKLLNQSHESLKDDYEVTGVHLDTLVTSAIRHGAIGARVTGAGFGGCAIALVKNEFVETMKQSVSTDYRKITGLEATFYEVNFTDGVGGIEQ
jgi:galactokinase